jgi:release factor glutamine methyltransferase
MNAREALREGVAALEGTESPFLDASLLLAQALGLDRSALLASGEGEIAEDRLGRYRASLDSRAHGLPVAYILGYREFWGRSFAVDRRVLIPRPDTETLVQAALRIGDELASRIGSTLRVHECCVGSGCVAVSLAAERPQWRISASDISQEALEVSRANAAALLDPLRPGGPLELRRGDLLSGQAEAAFDLVVANPPYVPSAEAAALLGLGWSEPLLALDGGSDGLDAIRALVPQAAQALAPGGALLIEADGGQAEEAAELFRASRFAEVEALLDLGGRPRVTVGRKPWKS